MKPFSIRLPSPLFLIAQLWRYPHIGIVDRLSVVCAFLALLAFDTKSEFHELDEQAFHCWLRRLGVSQRMCQLLFEPYVRSFAFDSATQISAAAVLSSLHFYLIRHQDDIHVSWLTNDPASLITEPILNYIEKHGGRVIKGNPVKGFHQASDGSISSVKISHRVDGVHGQLPDSAPHVVSPNDRNFAESLGKGAKETKVGRVPVSKLQDDGLPSRPSAPINK